MSSGEPGLSEPDSGANRLAEGLDAALASVRARTGPAVVLFSGGVDSGLVAWELQERPETALFTVGVPGSSDLQTAARAAPRVGMSWTGRAVETDRLAELAAELRSETESLSRGGRSIVLSLAGAFRFAPPGALVCGQGADELFFGYAHFRGLDAAAAERRRLEDLDRLRSEDWPRTERIARALGRTVLAPFLDPRFVDAALRVPMNGRWPERHPKEFWRGFARSRGLPEELASRPKRALQFGTGIERWLRRAERRGPRDPRGN